MPPNGTFQKWIHKTRSGECEIFPSHNNEILPCWLFSLTQKYFYEIKLKTFQTWRDSYLKMMEEEEVSISFFEFIFLIQNALNIFPSEKYLYCVHISSTCEELSLHGWGKYWKVLVKTFFREIRVLAKRSRRLSAKKIAWNRLIYFYKNSH